MGKSRFADDTAEFIVFDDEEDLDLSNPNHDPDRRFGTGSGGGPKKAKGYFVELEETD